MLQCVAVSGLLADDDDNADDYDADDDGDYDDDGDDDDDWGEFGGDGDRSFGQEMSQFGPTITSTSSSSLFGIVLPSHYQSLTGPHSLAFKALPFKQFLPTIIVHIVLKTSKVISWHGTHCKPYTYCVYVQCTLCMCTVQCEPGQR